MPPSARQWTQQKKPENAPTSKTLNKAVAGAVTGSLGACGLHIISRDLIKNESQINNKKSVENSVAWHTPGIMYRILCDTVRYDKTRYFTID